jgi:cephalosporin hydroxylase
VTFDKEFDLFRKEILLSQANNLSFSIASKDWLKTSVETKYSYGFDWLGVPIIQLPQDLLAFQEITFLAKPTVVIECGIARGGSAIFWASMQEICGIKPKVIGIDVDIRLHTLNAIENSRYKESINLILGDSTNLDTKKKVVELIAPNDVVLVVLDSNHTKEHVLKELQLYADLVSPNSYLIVLDCIIENLPRDPSRPWGPGDSPQSAVLEFMKNRSDFTNREDVEDRIALTVAPKGYWQRS